jgi:hypothetical protein
MVLRRSGSVSPAAIRFLMSVFTTRAIEIADRIRHFRAGACEQAFELPGWGVINRVRELAGAATAEFPRSTGILKMAAEEVEYGILGFLIFDVRHVGGRVEHYTSGIDAIMLGARPAPAAEMAHFGRGKGETMLTRAREDRGHRGSGPDRHRFALMALAGQQHLREATPHRIDRHDDRRDSRHRARGRVSAVIDRAHLADDIHAIANAAIPGDVPAQIDVRRGQTRSLQPGVGTIDEAAGIGAGAGEVEFEPAVLLCHRADDFVDFRIVAVVVDVLDFTPLAVRQFR